MKDWVALTREIAQLSDFPKKGRRTGCIIVNKNRAMAVGWNKCKNRYGVTVRGLFGLELRPTDHAEADALNKLGIPEYAKGCDIYVFRQFGGISMPCDVCLSYLLKYHVRRIIFENKEGQIIHWRNQNGATIKE